MTCQHCRVCQWLASAIVQGQETRLTRLTRLSRAHDHVIPWKWYRWHCTHMLGAWLLIGSLSGGPRDGSSSCTALTQCGGGQASHDGSLPFGAPFAVRLQRNPRAAAKQHTKWPRLIDIVNRTCNSCVLTGRFICSEKLVHAITFEMQISLGCHGSVTFQCW